jgi:beta-phosphoglucomutase-like phosphatase (HAD superfamily)
MSRLQAVFFDFDGVIADSEPLHLGAYQAVLKSDGIDLNKTEYYSRYLGYDDVGLFEALANDRGLVLTDEKIEQWVRMKSGIIEEMLQSTSIVFPGAAACVKMFAEQVPLAVASGALEPEIENVLEHAGLRPYFAAIASASDGVRGKPAPDLYLLAIAKLQGRLPDPFDPASSIAIEDSHWGIEAAQRAGLRCVAVTHTYPAAALEKADLVVDALSEVTLSKIEEFLRDNGAAR